MKKRIFLVFLVVLSFFLVSCNSNNIIGFKYSDEGELIGIYENGDEKNFGSPNNDSYSIESYYFNDKNELIIKYKNGTETNLGKIIIDKDDDINNDDVIHEDFVLRKETNGTYAIVGYLGYDQDIVIPDEYNGIEITRIKSYSIVNIEEQLPFDYFNITIGKNIVSIDYSGIAIEALNAKLYFKEDSKLNYLSPLAFNFEIMNEITLPEALISIGFYALSTKFGFKVPSSVKILAEQRTSLPLYTELVDKPQGWSSENKYLFGVESVKKNEDFSYYNFITKEIMIKNAVHDNIQNLVIPDEIDGYNIIYIANDAFSNNQIKELVLGKNIIKIGDNAFSNNNIGNISIPDSVIHLGNGSFSNNKITSINFSKSLTTISSYAFSSNNLTELEIPKNIQIIGKSAFAHNQITNIVIPNTVKEIKEKAFNAPLTNVTFEEESSLETIESYAFDSRDLRYIFLPNSVLNLGDALLGYSSGVIYTEHIEPLSSWSIAGNDFYFGIKDIVEDENFEYLLSTNSELYLMKPLKDDRIDSLIIPDESMGYPVTKIEPSAFNNKRVKELVIGKNIRVISKRSFYMNQLEEVFIPDSVEIIEEEAFRRYASFDPVKLYTTLKEIPVGWTSDYKYIII